MWPQGEPFLAPWAYFKQIGTGLLGDATYQISRLYALRFQRRRFVHVFPISAFVKHVTPWTGPFLATEA